MEATSASRAMIVISCLFVLVRTTLCFGDRSNRPYPGATYYWPLNAPFQGGIIFDLVREVRGDVYGAKFIKNERIGGALAFKGELDWIAFPPERVDSCIADPGKCTTGISFAFWIRFRSGKYILTTGGFTNSLNGIGIQITHDKASKRFKVLVREKEKSWSVSAPVYYGRWCHIALRWATRNGLQLFLDEKLMDSDKDGTAASQEYKAHWIKNMFTIARPPMLSQTEYGNFDMAHLAIWQNHISLSQVNQIGGLVLKPLEEPTIICSNLTRFCDSPNAVCLSIGEKVCKKIIADLPVTMNKPSIRTEPASRVTTLTKDVPSFTITEITTPEPKPSLPVKEYMGEIYRRAALYLHVTTSPKPTFADFLGRSTLQFIPRDKLSLYPTTQLGQVVGFNGLDNCIYVRGTELDCIKNPTTCEKTGFTLSFWLQNLINKKQSFAYNENSNTPSGTGFMIYNDELGKSFTVKVKTATKLWQVVMHKMPFEKDWWHFLITWSLTSGLSLYINGNFAIQNEFPQNAKGSITSHPMDNGPIKIGCPSGPFSTSLSNYGQFKLGHFAFWKKVFNLNEIRRAYKETIKETDSTKQCCDWKRGNKYSGPGQYAPGHHCVTCQKFKEPTNCADIFRSRNCICKESIQPNSKCKTGTPPQRCEDDPQYDCKTLASQTGYCNYFQAEMERYCPASCHLCDGLYRNAAHYFKTDANSLVDSFAKSRTKIFPKELKLVKTSQLGHVLSLNGQDYYVSIKGFQRECITDPNVCQTGLTVAFWLKMFSGKYVISGGKYRDEPRGSGFMISHDANSSQFRVSLATVQKKWSAILHKVPFMRQWFHLAFTWSQRGGLRVFINGHFVLQGAGAKERAPLPSPYEDNGIFIGGKDSSESRHSQVRFKIGHIAVWDYPLDGGKISMVFKGTITKNAHLLKCCKDYSGHKCVTNTCYKFKAPETCERFFRSVRCQCPAQMKSGNCKSHKFQGQCKDRRPDCKDLAAQEGYCEFYKQDMERLCPASCEICDVDSVLPKIENSHEQDNGTKILPEASKSSNFVEGLATQTIVSDFRRKNFTKQDSQIRDAMKKRTDDKQITKNSSTIFPLSKNEAFVKVEDGSSTKADEKTSVNSIVSKGPDSGKMKSGKLSKEVLIFSLIGCAAGIILLFLISLYSWKVYRSKFTGAFVPGFKAVSAIEVDEYGEEKWTKKYIDSSYFVIKDVPPKKRALPIIPSKPSQPKYHPPDFQ